MKTQTTSQFNNSNFGSTLLPIYVKCPQCAQNLMDQKTELDFLPGIKLDILNQEGSGTIWLSALYGSYSCIDTLNTRKGNKVRFFCPECSRELPTGNACKECNAANYSLDLITGGTIEFCSRKGCKYH